MIKKILNFKFLLLFVLFTGIMSCDKDTGNENLLDQIESEDIDIRDFTADIAGVEVIDNPKLDPEGMFPPNHKKCFTLVFPISMVFPNGDIIEFNSREEMGNGMREWKKAHPDVQGRPEFQFPLTVTLEDDTTKAFNSKEEFHDFIKKCRGDKPGHGDKVKRCFKPVFPITVLFPDSTTVTVESPEDLRSTMMEWRENNPGVQGKPRFVFPFDVELKDGTIVTVNSKDDLIEIVRKCKKRPHHKPNFKRCFKVVFPITIEFPNGTTKEIDSKETMRTVLMEWKENNPGIHDRPHITFPFDVELKNGKIITINNKEDLRKIMKRCKGKKRGHNG